MYVRIDRADGSKSLLDRQHLEERLRNSYRDIRVAVADIDQGAVLTTGFADYRTADVNECRELPQGAGCRTRRIR